MTQGFSGVGLVSAHQRTSGGAKGIGQQLGNCPNFEVQFTPNSQERNSSMDVSRAPLRRLTSSTQGAVTITCDEFKKANLAKFLQARVDEVAASGSTINHTFPTGALVGDVLGVPQTNVATMVITDSTGSPKTLVAGTNYEVDLFAGQIRLLDLTTGGPYVQPFKSAHTQGAVTVVAGLAVPQVDYWLSLAGTNADNGSRGVGNFFRCRMDIAAAMKFINEGYQDFEWKGSLLQDTTKLAGAIGGQYFSWSMESTHE